MITIQVLYSTRGVYIARAFQRPGSFPCGDLVARAERATGALDAVAAVYRQLGAAQADVGQVVDDTRGQLTATNRRAMGGK